MNESTPAYGNSLQAYANIRTAARVIGVSASTLSRRKDLAAEPRGERDRVLSTSEVLRLALVYRERSLNDVAQDLIDHAQKTSTTEAARVEEEVEEFFETRASQPRRDEFLAFARQVLPARLYNEVETTVSEQADKLPDGLFGDQPVPRP